MDGDVRDSVESSSEDIMQFVIEDTENASLEIREQKDVAKPYEGMLFATPEEAYEYYYMYGLKKGFAIRRSGFDRSRTNKEIITRKYSCNKEGFKRTKNESIVPRNRAVQRVGCQAKMVIGLTKEEKWMVRIFRDDHSHEMESLEKVMKQSSRRKLPDSNADKHWEKEKLMLLEQNSSLKSSLDSERRQAEGFHLELKMCKKALSHEESRRKLLEVQLSESRALLEDMCAKYQEEQRKNDTLSAQLRKSTEEISRIQQIYRIVEKPRVIHAGT